MEASQLSNPNVDKEFIEDAAVLKNFSTNNHKAIRSAIRFSCTVDGKYASPELAVGLKAIEAMVEEIRCKIINNYAGSPFCTFVRGYWYFGYRDEDPSIAVNALNLGLGLKNTTKKLFFFNKANHNPWSGSKTTKYVFFNPPMWKDLEESKSWYSRYGEVDTISPHCNSDTVSFKTLNWKLPYLWFRTFLRNKKKMTKIFCIPNSNVSVKVTSKAKCGTCEGYGHHSEACPKDFLPLRAALINEFKDIPPLKETTASSSTGQDNQVPAILATSAASSNATEKSRDSLLEEKDDSNSKKKTNSKAKSNQNQSTSKVDKKKPNQKNNRTKKQSKEPAATLPRTSQTSSGRQVKKNQRLKDYETEDDPENNSDSDVYFVDW